MSFNKKTIKYLYWGVALLLFGLLCRVLHLGRASYAVDEAVFVKDSVGAASFSELFGTELGRFYWYQHLFLVKFIIRAGVSLLGHIGPSFTPEWMARLPFALLGTLNLPLFYWLGVSVKDRTLGLVAMFLATVSVFHCFHSREAYDYGMMMFFSTGALASSIFLLREWAHGHRLSPRYIIAYVLFSSGLLQSHLCGLLFLAAWNLLMGLWVIFYAGSWRRFSASVWVWFATLSIPYIQFSPFLHGLATHKYSSLGSGGDDPWQAVVGLLGGMGWGRSLWAVSPFLMILLLGVALGLRRLRGVRRTIFILLLADLLLYFAIQTWVLRLSRFAVRYYASMYPIVVLLVAVGFVYICRILACRSKKFSEGQYLLTACLVLMLWLAPSLWCVANMHFRMPYNSKATARWVVENLPENGLYCFKNTDQFRVVPLVYPTPGRFGTYAIAANNTYENHNKYRVKDRLISFHSRYPLAAFIEVYPDILYPPKPGEPVWDPVPREALFARRVWLKDPLYHALVEMKTNPLGSNFDTRDHILISYNRPEDLPAMARKRNQPFYHYFGAQWKHMKDNQWNDWRYIDKEGSFIAGNATHQSRVADIKLQAMSYRGSCKIRFYRPNGEPIGDELTVNAGKLQDFLLKDVDLLPGDNELMIRVLNNSTGHGPLLVLSCFVMDVKKPADDRK